MLICLYGEMRDALWPEHEAFRFHGPLCACCGFSAGASDRFAARQRRRVTDRGNVGLVGLQRAALERCGSRYKRVRAGGGQLAGDVRRHAAVDLDIDRTSRGHRPDVADLAERGFDEGLSTEAGID